MTYESKFWHLKNHHLFSNLNSSEMQNLCIVSEFETAKKNEIIFFAHNDGDYVYTVKKGVLKIIQITDSGEEIVKDIVGEGDLFGNFTFTDELEDDYAVAASDRVIICCFRIADFENLLERNPNLSLKYTKFVGLKIKRINNLYANLMFKDVKTRFKLFLREWAIKEGAKPGSEFTLKNYLTHKDIAGLICCSRQTASNLFSELKNEGLIDYDRKFIYLSDIKKLD